MAAIGTASNRIKNYFPAVNRIPCLQIETEDLGCYRGPRLSDVLVSCLRFC